MSNGVEEMTINSIDENGTGYATNKVYPYVTLSGKDLPSDVDPSKKETYLSDAEFEKKFGMDRLAFESSPNWKQVVLKKKLGLF